MSDEIVIGIDGGGSRTRAAAADLEGRLLAWEEAGGANPHVVGVERAFATVRDLGRTLLERTGRDASQIAGWCCGLAGVERSEDREPFFRIAQEFRCGDRLLVTTDAVIALAGGTLSDRGVLVHAGTGSIVYGRDDDSTARTGGWGTLLDDAGSGYAIGRAALRRVMRAYDGREPQSALRDAILARLGLAQETDLVLWSSSSGRDAAAVADLAPVVLEVAAQEDPAAMEIADDAADELALMVRALGRAIPINAQTLIILSGGLFQHSEAFCEQVRRKIRFYYPDVTVERPKMPPVAGALLYALNRAGVKINRVLLDRLKQHMEQPDAAAGAVSSASMLGEPDSPAPGPADAPPHPDADRGILWEEPGEDPSVESTEDET